MTLLHLPVLDKISAARLAVIAATLLSALLPVSAASADPGARGRAKFQPFLTKPQSSVEISGGLRQSDMRWNVAGNMQGTNPNIMSELTWKDVQMVEANINARHLRPAGNAIFRGALQLEGTLKGGLGVDGKVRDSDYLFDNRAGEFSRATADANSGYALGAQGGIGYRFNVAQRIRPHSRTMLTLAPVVGYGWEMERFMLEGVQVSPPPVGTPSVLDSEYNAHWYGPFVGVEAQWEHNRHMLTLRGEYHDLKYKSDAQWNLRTDLKQDPSYEQEADEASAYKIMLQYGYAIDSRYEVVVNLSHSEREASNGTSTMYFTNGATAKTRLNEVEHTTQAIHLGLKYHW